MRKYQKGEGELAILGMIIVGGFLLFGGVGGCMYGYPQYKVYQQRLEGESELAKANYSKQVAVQEAVAKRDTPKPAPRKRTPAKKTARRR